VRIISGSARGTKLATFTGCEIRPTSDRVRGAIFSKLCSRLGSFNKLKILDIFAGTGAMGLEALSRGAETAVFVDKGQQAKKIISSNSKHCHLQEKTRIINQNAQTALGTLTEHHFDLIFIDPPYNKGMLPQIIQLIDTHKLLATNGIICAEEDKQASIPEQIGVYELLDRRDYGNTSIYLFSSSEE